MIQSVTIRQATKAGIAIWKVGGWQIYPSQLQKQGEAECREMEIYVQP